MRAAARSSTPRSCRCPSNTTRGGERDDQGRQDAGGMEASPPRTPRRTRTRAGRRRMTRLLRLQEPHRRGQGAQADPQMGCDGAAVHDSQKLDDVLDLSNTGKEVWADSAYRSMQIEAGLKAKGLQSRIHRRAARNRRCQSARSRRTRRARRCAPVSSMYSVTSRTRWAARSCAPSASCGRGSRSG